MFEDLTTFLSTSTIHGLAYLPASRRLARIFWLLVVVSGFSTAAFLIVKSFRGRLLHSHWSRSFEILAFDWRNLSVYESLT